MLSFDELWEILTTQDESVEIEVKKASEVGKSCWQTISAFSNEPGLGGGYLVLGIRSPQDSNSGEYEIEGIGERIIACFLLLSSPTKGTISCPIESLTALA